MDTCILQGATIFPAQGRYVCQRWTCLYYLQCLGQPQSGSLSNHYFESRDVLYGQRGAMVDTRQWGPQIMPCIQKLQVGQEGE